MREGIFPEKDALKRNVRNMHGEHLLPLAINVAKFFAKDHLRKQHAIVCAGSDSQDGTSGGGVCDVCGKFFYQNG